MDEIQAGLVASSPESASSTGRYRKRTDEEYNEQWIARVRAKCVVTEKGCWIWQGFKWRNGYGATTYRSRNCIIHRKMYELANAVKLGRWEYACHSCDVKLCCNPDHLWKGTPLENQVDSVMKRRNGEQQVTHCPRGHEYNEENTEWKVAKSGRPARECKTCVRLRHSSPEYRAKARERQRRRRAQKHSQVTA